MVFGICSNCFTVFAFDDTNEGGSETATEKFNEFLSALTPEAASAIRQDDEMVYMMTQDFYWSPPTVSSARRASLPLSEYGNGTYYTNNGLACICHAKCTYSTPGAKDTLCYIIDQKKYGNCKRYAATGSIQCKGFADYVFKQYTGSDISSSSQGNNWPTTISNTTTGIRNLKTYITSLPIGSNVRFNVRNASYNHSLIIMGISDTGITVYDCNGTSSACKVRVGAKTWQTLASEYEGIVSVWLA